MNTKMLKSIRRYQIAVLALGVFCAAAIATNFVLRQGPAHDTTIESDFRAISQAIDASVGHGLSSTGTLPTSLSELSGLSSDIKKRLAHYDYKPSLSGQYELCATFATQGKNTTHTPFLGGQPDTVGHTKGYQCFAYQANIIYPVGPQPIPLRN